MVGQLQAAEIIGRARIRVSEFFSELSERHQTEITGLQQIGTNLFPQPMVNHSLAVGEQQLP